MSMVKIRGIKETDLQQLKQLLRTRDNISENSALRRWELLQWLAFKNPFTNGQPTYFVAEDKGNVVGHLGLMPMKFLINGHLEPGYFMQDLYVHPEYRKRGMGFFISMALYNQMEKEAKSFICGLWASPLNLKMLQKRGYENLQAEKYVRIIDPRAIQKVIRSKTLKIMVYPILRIVLGFINYVTLRDTFSRIRVSRVQRFRKEFDEFLQGIQDKFTICPLKDSTYLNWKYIDRPYSENVVFAAYRGETLSGYIVLSPKTKSGYIKGHILDLMADPEDKATIKKLCKTAILHYKKEGVYSVHSYITHPKLKSCLKRLLFIKDTMKDSVFLANLHKCKIPTEILVDISNWYVNYGDSDGFMLH